MKCIITVGISCSGKTTLAKQLEEDGWVDINRDKIRFNIICPGTDWGSYKFTKKREQAVTDFQDRWIACAASEGRNIIVSDTNLNTAKRESLVGFCKGFGYEVEIRDMEVSLEEAWKRDSLRGNGVGYQVIYKQWLQWLDYVGRKKYTPDQSLPKAVIYDLDGTMASMEGRRGPFDWSKVGLDSPREFICEMAHMHHLLGYTVIVCSGRDAICRSETESWLLEHNIAYDHLFMREISDTRKDAVIKEEIFWREIAEKFNVVAAVEDRPVMQRFYYELGVENVIGVANPWLEF